MILFGKNILLLLAGLGGLSIPLIALHQARFNCLPAEVQLTDIVEATHIDGTLRRVSVQEKLDELGASCQSNQLVDRSDQAIRFYKLEGCWGNPPINYGEILAQQNQAIALLRERYTVIEMTCNPTGIPYP